MIGTPASWPAPFRFCLALLVPAALLFSVLGAAADDTIYFTNRVETITNLHGVVYSQVEVQHTTKDGFIYRSSDGSTLGLIRFNDLDPGTLERFNLSTNLIAEAQKRKEAQDAAAKAYAKASANSKAQEQERQLWLQDTMAPGMQGGANASQNGAGGTNAAAGGRRGGRSRRTPAGQ